LQQIFAVDSSGNALVSGTLSKAGGSFKIDDPIDPANKYLSHSFVESPDMMNIYNGTVHLDAKGQAVVEMPDWFSALNRDFQYQLTAIGAPAPRLYIAEKMQGNHFRIAGGKKGQEVSWMVTGIRQDAWANAHRIPTEEVKPANEQGKYLHPELFGAGPQQAVGAVTDAKRQMKSVAAPGAE
jgi:trimeric autotransporter adhesin